MKFDKIIQIFCALGLILLLFGYGMYNIKMMHHESFDDNTNKVYHIKIPSVKPQV